MEKQAAEENQSFFSKYWLYILLAIFILPKIIGEGPEEGAAGAAGGAAAPAKK